MSQYGFVIPNYNHHLVIEDTLDALVAFNLPIILVDDGSDAQTQQVLDKVANKFELVTLVRRSQNGGKGAAVQTGLSHAFTAGWTHAIQVDADGQHDLNDVEQLISRSKFAPTALVSGQPVYDSSISKGRYYGRFITHFWVYIETLSLQLKDTMCGFRVYPLAAYDRLIKSSTLGNKMDFDIEIMVKLFWQGTPVEFIKTKVHYPENGVSHFNVWEDNVLISKMHTRLFFGMLLRLPRLIANKFK
ncbi:glycosyltransferase family 2 protein [Pseudoalteromonas sp. MMG010]|uniref:glycosyltransferase family 2 protein n=1 Tax=Pseudoalteromonas sp. MMG010 TaxID=2822685 RepID=UPI001B3A68C6|nr:glycosyltransferase family 2 protein [Pseudoalteromonas sp. MMG010]MBQ4833477.1 glycosyltransferase family 2 protein [Pseudoalteromonas sp. MMG010]